MANREFSVLFKINAALSEQFGDALKSAQSAMKGLSGVSKFTTGTMSKDMAKLQGKYADMNKIAAQMQKYRDLQQRVQNTDAAYRKARADNRAIQDNYIEQTRQLKDYQKAYKQMQAYFKDNKSNMSEGERESWKAQLQSAREEIKAQKVRQKEAGQAVDKQSVAMQRLQSQLGGQTAALNAARAALSSAGISAQTFANEEARLRAEIERTTAAIERQGQIDSRRQRFTEAGQNLSNAHGEFQAAVDTAKGIMSPFKSAVDEAIDYEHQMSKLKALTQTKNIRAGDFETVNREMAAMDKTISQLGATTEFTTSEVAQAAQKFAMSGWNSQQINDALKPVIDITTATGNRDVVKIADYLTDEMQAFGLTDKTKFSQEQIAENMKHYGDIFAYALTQSNNDADSFHEAIKYIAPVAKMAGMSTHETAAMSMVMADSGIKGSMAGTSGRMGLLRMLAPPKAAVKAMEEMGLLSSDATKKMAEVSDELQSIGINADDSIVTRIDKMKKAFDGMDEKEVAAKMSKITGVNAVSGWGALFKDLEHYKDVIGEMDSGKIEGWAETVSGTMRDDTFTDIELLNSAMSSLSKTVGDMLLPTVRQGLQAVTQFVSGLEGFAKANPQIVQGLAGIAAGLSSLIVASAGAKLAMAGWEYVSSGFGVLKDMVTGLGTRMLSVFNAIRGISFAGMFAGLQAQVAGVMTMISGIPARIMTAFTALRGLSLAGMLGSLAGMAGPILIAVAAAGALAGAAYMIINNWSAIAPVLSGIGNTLMSSLQSAFSAIQPAISSLMTSIQRLMPAFAIIGTGLVGGLLIAVNAAANLFGGLVGFVANVAAAIVNVFSGIGNVIASVLAGDLSGAFNNLVSMAKSVGTNIAEALIAPLRAIKDTVTGFFDPAINFVKGISGSGGKVESNFSPNQLSTSPTSSVQAQTVQVQAAQVEQTQSTDIFAGLSEQVSQFASSFTNIGTSAEQFSTSTQALSTATESTATNLQPISEGFAQLSASIQPVAEGFTQLSSSVQPVGETFTQLSAAVQPTAEGFNQINAGVTTFNAELTNTGSQLQAANAGVQAFTAALTGTNGAIAGFTGALTGSVGAVSGLGSAASGASGAISGLGSAASSACAALAAAGANAAAAVSAAAASIPTAPVAANFRGGIYPKGEFITTFAEKSAEAAIPLDNSSRAVSLWQQVGQILGLLPGESNVSYERPEMPDLYKVERLIGGKVESESGSLKGGKVKSSSQPNLLSTSPGIRWTGGKVDSNSLTNFSPFKLSTLPTALGNIFSERSGLDIGGLMENPLKSIGNIFSGIREQVGGVERWKGGKIESILSPFNLFNSLPDLLSTSPPNSLSTLSPNALSTPQSDIHITFEVNIAGNANAEDVRNGIEQAIPSVEDFAARLSEYRHEQQRVSFN